ncbi:4a-hydroxytetrahydrobiopterin dehydratase [Aspergillus aculeatinus CBS 121060]|uniref:Transcriptional coactivator/pterin dehydratase n=1 Tax=Aspergillus aculeatinus CBS 121060 TaxID=1448322 RepID=A0ACD1GZ25_9EURO|nr:transcriptional coactivator/pterin dehydratase [Aspergillus aculeatinus CBS 121060]RAH66600.1 transcriptional coactivator/pterin dehydratase [Aspergillus aculeatinus CBS 121060]
MDHIIRASPRPCVLLSRLQRSHFARPSTFRFYSSVSSSASSTISPARPVRTTPLTRSTPTSSLRTQNHSTSSPSTTTRVFSSSMSASANSAAVDPQFAEGVDAEELRPRLTALLQPEQGWTLDAEGQGLQKTYFFKTYFKAVSFVNVVASQSATMKHHPTMTVRIGSVDIHWTTHHPRGLTGKDVDMAQHCDEAAELMGAVEAGQGRKCH